VVARIDNLVVVAAGLDYADDQSDSYEGKSDAFVRGLRQDLTALVKSVVGAAKNSPELQPQSKVK
jgi:hypothetical protein